LEFDCLAASRLGQFDQLFGQFDAAVMVDADFGNDKAGMLTAD
jgi:hypothetical protein